MPTSYTATLLTREVSFEEFVWYCAHAFLPIGRQGGDTSSMPLSFVADGRAYRVAIERSKNRIAALEALTDEEFWTQTQPGARTRAEAAHRDRAIFQQMLERAEGWKPPSSYQSIRDFMLAQLRLELGVTDDVEATPEPGPPPAPPVEPANARRLAIEEEQHTLAGAEHKLGLLTSFAERLTTWITGLVAVIGEPPRIAPPFALDH